jgi:predicted nucleotidyltransferase
MNIRTIIQGKHKDFVALCKAHNVDKLYAFGSSITDHFDPKTSDIDVVVKIDIDDPADRGDALLSLWDQLEILFDRKVDLLTEDSIRNPYLKRNIDRTKQLIYDGEGEKVFI